MIRWRTCLPHYPADVDVAAALRCVQRLLPPDADRPDYVEYAERPADTDLLLTAYRMRFGRRTGTPWRRRHDLDPIDRCWIAGATARGGCDHRSSPAIWRETIERAAHSSRRGLRGLSDRDMRAIITLSSWDLGRAAISVRCGRLCGRYLLVSVNQSGCVSFTDRIWLARHRLADSVDAFLAVAAGVA